jgi:hypothetical protein
MLRRFRTQLRMRHEPDRSHAISNADQHHSLSCQHLSTVGRNGGGAGIESAAIDPDQHRELSGGRFCGHPDIEIEAVLAHCGSFLTRRRKTPLHALRRKSVGVPHTIPLRRWFWGTPAQITYRRRCKGNAAIDGQSLFHSALQQALLNLHSRIRGRTHQRCRHHGDCKQNPFHLQLPCFLWNINGSNPERLLEIAFGRIADWGHVTGHCNIRPKGLDCAIRGKSERRTSPRPLSHRKPINVDAYRCNRDGGRSTADCRLLDCKLRRLAGVVDCVRAIRC